MIVDLRFAITVPIVALAAACASPPQPTTPPAPPPTTPTTPTVISANDAGTPQELFDKGKKLLVEEKYAEAAQTFELVAKGDPDGPLAPMALLEAGIAYDGAGDPKSALARYRDLVAKYPKDPLQKVALLRIGRELLAGESWGDLDALADQLLARADLTINEAIEANAHKALALVGASKIDQADRSITKARTLMEDHHIGETGRIPNEVAETFYALGETRRIKSEEIKFDPTPPNFGDAFERRAQGLLDAQSAYTDVMRTTDAAWATMAGFRVGELYRNLHRDVMAAKFPDVGKTKIDKQLFEGAMRLRYRVLLKKGLAMMTSTVNLTDRVGENDQWSARAKAAKAELEQALADENAALAKLPYSEADLQKLLDQLQASAAKKATKPPPP